MNYDKGTKVKKTRIFNWIFDKSHGYCANIQLPNFLFLLQHHDLGSRSKHDDHGGSKGQTLCTSQVCSKVFSYLSKQGHQLFLTLISDNEFWKQRKAIKTFAKRTCLQSDDDEYNLSTCVKVSLIRKSFGKRPLFSSHFIDHVLNTKCCMKLVILIFSFVFLMILIVSTHPLDLNTFEKDVIFPPFLSPGLWVETAMQNSCNIIILEDLKMKRPSSSPKMP